MVIRRTINATVKFVVSAMETEYQDGKDLRGGTYVQEGVGCREWGKVTIGCA
jgi:hypothetical protein